MKHISLLALATFPAASCHATDTKLERAPVELGRVRWERGLELGCINYHSRMIRYLLMIQSIDLLPD
jgi:hypothetical protein